MAQTRKQQKQKQKQKSLKQKGGNWLKEVKQAHTELKRKNPDASLGDAMKLASKRRKSH